jgi:hypothetical protein
MEQELQRTGEKFKTWFFMHGNYIMTSLSLLFALPTRFPPPLEIDDDFLRLESGGLGFCFCCWCPFNTFSQGGTWFLRNSDSTTHPEPAPVWFSDDVTKTTLLFFRAASFLFVVVVDGPSLVTMVSQVSHSFRRSDFFFRLPLEDWPAAEAAMKMEFIECLLLRLLSDCEPDLHRWWLRPPWTLCRGWCGCSEGSSAGVPGQAPPFASNLSMLVVWLLLFALNVLNHKWRFIYIGKPPKISLLKTQKITLLFITLRKPSDK